MADELPHYKGIVVSKKANFLIVELDSLAIDLSKSNYISKKNPLRFLCTLRRRLVNLGVFVNVGDYVYLESIDWNTHRAVVKDLQIRNSFLNRPPVANVTEVFVVLSVKKPEFYLEQASRFLLTAEKTNLTVKLVLTKIDLISNTELFSQIKRMRCWGYKPLAVSFKNG